MHVVSSNASSDVSVSSRSINDCRTLYLEYQICQNSFKTEYSEASEYTYMWNETSNGFRVLYLKQLAYNML